MKQPRYYIAYGDNLNIVQMASRCSCSSIEGTAVLQGYQLVFRGSPTGATMNIEERASCNTPVGIWKISEEDEETLDRIEGFPGIRYKQEFRILCKNILTGKQKRISGFTYSMKPGKPLGMPSPDYFTICKRGYADFHLDLSFLQKAVDDTRQMIREEAGE